MMREVNLYLDYKMCFDGDYKTKSNLYSWIYFLMILFLIIALKFTGLIALVMFGLYKINQQSKKNKNRSLRFYGYKIFKFLINQISSGIRVSDAIMTMHMVVSPSPLKNTLIDVAAHYGQTADLQGALYHLKKTFKGLEVDTLCMAIEQGIKTGANESTLLKMENLLFKRYIFQIKSDTVLKRKRAILSVLFLGLIIILMILVPVAIDMLHAFNQIFF